MEVVDLEVKVAELTATLNQQSERMAQLLSQMEEMKLQAPQSHPPPLAFVHQLLLIPMIGSTGSHRPLWIERFKRS